jgi:two-component system LytT family response regulator
MLKVIIVDDEKASRDTLAGLLKRYCQNVEVIAQAEGYAQGIEVISANEPDVVFLDIQMPDGSGFKLIEDLGEVKFEVIFTTAYDQYAIKAIKYSALDYLLKPVVPDDLVNAVKKAEQKKNAGQMNQNIKILLENLAQKNEPRKIVLSTAEKMHIVEIDDIIRCESDDYYTRFYFKDGKTLLISKTLKENEELLGEKYFIRPHKSHLVNIKYIKGFLKNDGGYIVMSDGTKVPVSRRKREYVVSTLSHL